MKQVHLRVDDELYNELNAYSVMTEQTMQDLSLIHIFRIIGEVTPEKIRMVQDADAIWREEIGKAGLSSSVSQYYAALTNMKSVGVMGDERTYD